MKVRVCTIGVIRVRRMFIGIFVGGRRGNSVKSERQVLNYFVNASG